MNKVTAILYPKEGQPVNIENVTKIDNNHPLWLYITLATEENEVYTKCIRNEVITGYDVHVQQLGESTTETPNPEKESA